MDIYYLLYSKYFRYLHQFSPLLMAITLTFPKDGTSQNFAPLWVGFILGNLFREMID